MARRNRGYLNAISRSKYLKPSRCRRTLNEMAGYGTPRTYAEQLGEDEAASLLERNQSRGGRPRRGTNTNHIENRQEYFIASKNHETDSLALPELAPASCAGANRPDSNCPD